MAISRHALANGWLKPNGLGKVSADVIRQIERDGHVPSERVRLVISLFLGVPYTDIWDRRNRQIKRRRNPARKAVAA